MTFWPGLQPFLACLSHPAHCPLPLGGRASASHLGPRQALPSCSGAGGQQGPGAPPRPQPEIVQQPPELLLGEQAHKPEPGSLPRAQGHCRQPAALLGGDRGGGCTGSVAAALATSGPGLPGGLGLWSRQTRTVCGRYLVGRALSAPAVRPASTGMCPNASANQATSVPCGNK